MLAKYEIAIVFDLPPGWTKWGGHIYDTQIKPLLPRICDALIKENKTKLVVAGGRVLAHSLIPKMVELFPGISWAIYYNPENDAVIRELATKR